MKKMRKPRKPRLLVFFTLFMFLMSTAGTAFAASSDVSTYAGNGYSGQMNGPATTANFSSPLGMALDSDGGLLVVDTGNNLIRKILGGQVTTFAGLVGEMNNFGLPKGGFSDGEVTKAQFNGPRYIDVSEDGTVYLTDTGSNLIRKISEGKVTTVSGKGKSGYLDGSRKDALFNCPSGIAVDPFDNIYIADSLNHVIRLITPTGYVLTFAGVRSDSGGYKDGTTKTALFNEPTDLALDGDGALYVLDSGNQLIRKIYKGKVTTIAGSKGALLAGTNYAKGELVNGNGIDGHLNFPKGIFATEDGILFIADTWNHVVRALLKNGNLITIAGTGSVGAENSSLANSSFNGPGDVVLSENTLYVSDMWNNTIRSFTVNPSALEALKVGIDPMAGVTLKSKGSTPQVWVAGKAASITKKDFSVNGSTMLISIPAVAKAFGATAIVDKKKSSITIKKGALNVVIRTNKKPVTVKAGVPMMDIRLLAEKFGLGSYFVAEKNAMILYSK